MSQVTRPQPHTAAIKFTMLIAGAVFALMMILGLAMRAAQSNLIEIDPALFYQLLSAHGAGMVGTAGLSGAAIMWYFTGRYVALNAKMYGAFISLFLLGVGFILIAIFIGQYGGAWTFLYPLPALSGGAWEPWAAALFILVVMLQLALVFCSIIWQLVCLLSKNMAALAVLSAGM